MFSKFKTFETNLSNRRLNFQNKLPEIEKTLTLVQHLKSKVDNGDVLSVQYNLADTVYASAVLDNAGTVNLWLGANVMLSYTYDEAIDLLSRRQADAKAEYEGVIDDLAFTRNQSITAEVNMSRIYNWDVRNRRANKERDESGAGAITNKAAAATATTTQAK